MDSLYLSYLRKFPIDRGKHKLAKKIDLNKLSQIVEFTNSMGIQFSLDLNEYQMKQIYLYDIYEKNTIRHLIKLLNKQLDHKTVFFDVGTNIGFFTLTAAKTLQGRPHEIHCFEPNEFTLNLLESNLKKNPDLKTNVKVNPIGLSNKKDEVSLSYSDDNIGAASIYGSDSQKKTTIIKLDTLDTYTEENGVNSIDFLKVDIEGAELQFLEGAEKTISRSKNLIMIMEIVEENCLRGGYSSEELFNKVMSFGFKAYLPKSWPQPLKKVDTIPNNYHDNIIFIKS